MVWTSFMKLRTVIPRALNSCAGTDASPSTAVFTELTFASWHQDIKPENILVKSKAGSSKWDVQLMVADLGLSHFKMSKSGGTQEIDEDTHGSRAYGRFGRSTRGDRTDQR